MKHSIAVAEQIAGQNPSLAPRLYRALEKPFAVYASESDRRKALALLAAEIDRKGFSEYSRKAIAASNRMSRGTASSYGCGTLLPRLVQSARGNRRA